MRTATENDRDPVSAVPAPPNSGNAGQRERSSWRRFRLRNWRVSVRLVALIVIPTMVAGVLAGLRVVSALNNATAFTRIEHLATLSDRVSRLTHGLEAERDSVAMAVSAKHGLDDENVRQSMQQVNTAVGAVRSEAAAVDGSYPTRVRDKVRDVLNRLDKLPALRQITAKTQMPADVTIDKYGQFITDLVGLDDVIVLGTTDPDLAQDVRAPRIAVTREGGLLPRARVPRHRDEAHRFLPSGFDGFQAARAQRDSELAALRPSATPAENQLYADTVTVHRSTGPSSPAAGRQQGAAVAGPGPEGLRRPGRAAVVRRHDLPAQPDAGRRGRRPQGGGR